MTRDPDFGAILALGRGGVDVEQLDRVLLTACPLDLVGARTLVAEAGVEDPGEVVARTLVALSDLASAHPEVTQVDVNPLVVGPDGTVAVDALVVVGD
jgi:succinyl-CoA synthetase beta subunit